MAEKKEVRVRQPLRKVRKMVVVNGRVTKTGQRHIPTR